MQSVSGAGHLRNLQVLALEHRQVLLQFARQYASEAAAASVRELSATTTLLRNLKNGAEVYVVGTAHVSQASAKEVRDMIRLVQPQTVVLELCKARLEKVRNASQGKNTGFLQSVASSLQVPGSMRDKLFGAGISGMYGMLKSFGLEPGGEFAAGIQEAEKTGAEIVCGDQDQHVTVRNLTQHISLKDLFSVRGDSPALQQAFEKSASFSDKIEAFKTRELTKEISRLLREQNPGLTKVLVDDRDKILTRAMLQVKGRGVAVVGIAHLDGIQQNWEQAMDGSIVD